MGTGVLSSGEESPEVGPAAGTGVSRAVETAESVGVSLGAGVVKGIGVDTAPGGTVPVGWPAQAADAKAANISTYKNGATGTV